MMALGRKYQVILDIFRFHTRKSSLERGSLVRKEIDAVGLHWRHGKPKIILLYVKGILQFERFQSGEIFVLTDRSDDGSGEDKVVGQAGSIVIDSKIDFGGENLFGTSDQGIWLDGKGRRSKGFFNVHFKGSRCTEG